MFTIGPYGARMVQPRCVSRFYGQLSMLEARIERAGVMLSGARSSTGKCEAAEVLARYEELFDPVHISQMRRLLGAVAVTGLAALCLMLVR